MRISLINYHMRISDDDDDNGDNDNNSNNIDDDYTPNYYILPARCCSSLCSQWPASPQPTSWRSDKDQSPSSSATECILAILNMNASVGIYKAVLTDF